MNAIPIDKFAEDGFFDVTDEGAVVLVCRLCDEVDDTWYREVNDLRQAAVMWDEHVGQVHS